jgi:hypothetical protein
MRKLRRRYGIALRGAEKCQCQEYQALKGKAMTAEDLLRKALSHVESQSIRAWAESDHNRPLLLQIAERAVKHAADAGKPEPDALNFATFIMCQAIGL